VRSFSSWELLNRSILSLKAEGPLLWVTLVLPTTTRTRGSPESQQNASFLERVVQAILNRPSIHSHSHLRRGTSTRMKGRSYYLGYRYTMASYLGYRYTIFGASGHTAYSVWVTVAAFSLDSTNVPTNIKMPHQASLIVWTLQMSLIILRCLIKRA
jgi:hypothetical protein